MSRLTALSGVRRATYKTLQRFPLVLLAAASATAAGQLLVDGGSEKTLLGLLFSSLLGLPLFLAVELTGERRAWSSGSRWLARLVAAGVLAGFYVGWLGWSDRLAVTRFVQLGIGFHLLVAVLPYARRGELDGFWQYNRILFLRFLTAGVFSGVLFAGLAIALAAVDNLFGVHVAEETYLRLWLTIAFLFNTWFFLAGVPDDFEELERRQDYPRGLKVFAQFILIPLVVTYLVILTLYLGKVVWVRVWPSGWIGYLVSTVAAAGIFSLLLVQPVRERAENRWIATYARWFFLAILPAVGMLLMAIGKRIGQYGVTENRYFLVVLAVWLGAIALYYTFTGSRNIKVIPATLALLAFVTMAGPWSAYGFAERSQRGRLASLLESNRILVEGHLQPASGEVPFEDRKEIAASLSYLIEMHGTTSLEPWFGTPLAQVDTIAGSTSPAEDSGEARRRTELLMAHIGLRYVGPRQTLEAETGLALHSDLESTFESVGLPVSGHDYTFRILTWPPTPVRIEGIRYDLAYDPEAGELKLLREEDALVALPLGPAVERGQEFLRSNPANKLIPAELLRVEAESERARATVYLELLTGRMAGDSLKITGARAQVFVSLRNGT